MEEVPPLPDDVLELGRGLIPRPVFLVGCARSGTSILGETLAAHPAVAYLFEASFIWNDLVPARADHRLVASDAGAEVARQIYEALAREREGLPGNVLLEKNPKHVLRLPFLAALFPHARFVHIIRDGRDVAVSLAFRNRGTRWGHLEVPGWRDLLERYPERNHVRCALQWRAAVSIARADAERLPPGSYLEVRYESLVREPAATLERALTFLDLPAAAEVDAFLPRIQDVTAGSYHARKQVRHYVDNHARRIGRYTENLSPAEVEELEEACGDLLAALGYL